MPRWNELLRYLNLPRSTFFDEGEPLAVQMGAKLEAAVGTKPSFTATHEHGRFTGDEKKDVDALFKKLKDEKKGKIKNLVIEEKNDYPPSPFNRTFKQRNGGFAPPTLPSEIQSCER